MSAEQPVRTDTPAGGLPEGEAFHRNIATRRRVGTIWRTIFLCSLIIGIVTLATLLYNIADESFGIVAVQSKVSEEELLGDRPIEELSKEELLVILQENLSRSELRRLQREQPLEELNRERLITILRENVLDEEIVGSWPLHQALFDRAAIEAEVAEEFPRAELRYRSWLSWSFLTTPMASTPAFAGVRTALLGSLWMILITMLIAFPIGVGAAIYLQEYADDNRLNRIIQTNINNLAGVPSIIYGMLGLAIFVRTLERFTSGAAFGVIGVNGRTLISASLTMALLILPLIIINAQEAIRAVPSSLRQASYGLGATKWQTVWNHVLPVAFPGILTGTILAMSRAIGETAPLILIGASTFIVADPDGPFSKFTALPIQIYNWTAQPQDQFRDIAAAAIIVLLVLLLSLNSVAVILRNRFRRSI